MSYMGAFFGQYEGHWWGYVSQVTGGGPAIDYRWLEKGKKKVLQTIERVDEIFDEFSEKQNSEVYEKAAYQELNSMAQTSDFLAPLITQYVPYDRSYITYEQLLKIKYDLTMKYLRLKHILDDEDVLIALYAN